MNIRRWFKPALCLALFLLVGWTFLPSLGNGFVNYDDTCFVTANEEVKKGLTWENVGYAFRSPVAVNWHPLTTLSHMLDCELYGLRPWGHHLGNILLHAVNTVMLFLVFWRMTGAVWRCAVLAALFGLHPLRVESVAWVSERKDVLSTLFWMLTMLTYVRYVKQSKVSSLESKVSYGLALVFFALGLMSKPMLVTLPFVLLLLDYWPLNRRELMTQDSRLKTLLPLVREKLPFFGLAVAAGVVAFAVQAAAENIKTTGQYVLVARVQNAMVSYCRYLGKLFWPVDLSPFYPYPAGWAVATVLWSGLALLGLSVLAAVFGRQRRYLATGWLWFVGTLVPVIGLVQIGKQSLADHYTYIPSIGFLLVVVWGVHDLTARWRYRGRALSGWAVAAALACIALTRQQISHWKNDETLWRHALAVTKTNAVAHCNLSTALAHQGALDEAIWHSGEAIRLGLEHWIVHNTLGYALAGKQRSAEAIREYKEALRLNPGDAEAHNNLGSIFLRQGQVEKAILHYAEALRLQADCREARGNLALALVSRGRYLEAATQLREVIRLDPKDVLARQRLDQVLAARDKTERAIGLYREVLQTIPDDAWAHSKLGRLLLEVGKLDDALHHCAEAARLDPKRAEMQYQLGAAYARKGETEKATHQFELALALEPRLTAAHQALGILYQHQRRLPEALKHWREAARLAPQWPEPLNSLAWVLATHPHDEFRDGVEAVELARRAVELSGTNNPSVLDTLAAAYAEAGRFAEASSTARQAAAAARGQAELAEQIQLRLALYRANRPYRQEPGTP